MESQRKGRKGFVWRVATALPTACSGEVPAYPTNTNTNTNTNTTALLTACSGKVPASPSTPAPASTRGKSLVPEQSWCKAATLANARLANGSALRRFARRGVPYQATRTTQPSTDVTMTSTGGARTPWSSTASSLWRWRTWLVVEPSPPEGFVLSAAS